MKLSEQILKAGTSAPANYEESDDATGSRDKAAKRSDSRDCDSQS